MIDDRHSEWKAFIRGGIGIDDIYPNPYWTFDEIANKLQTKLNNLMYVRAETRVDNEVEYFKYNSFEAFVDPTLERFLALIEDGDIYVDFDARTGHNHGTKFRIRPSRKVDLYQSHIVV